MVRAYLMRPSIFPSLFPSLLFRQKNLIIYFLHVQLLHVLSLLHTNFFMFKCEMISVEYTDKYTKTTEIRTKIKRLRNKIHLVNSRWKKSKREEMCLTHTTHISITNALISESLLMSSYHLLLCS